MNHFSGDFQTRFDLSPSAARKGRLSAAGAPGLSQEIRDPEQQRLLLLEQLEQQQQQLGRTISNEDGQGRFALVRNILRNLALSAVYIGGFLAIGRRRPSTLTIS
jgi:hypothetical protein